MIDVPRGRRSRRVPLVLLVPLLLGPLARAHTPPAPSPRAVQLAALGKRLGTRPTRLENPAALAPFLASLEALAQGRATAPLVISAFGNSLIAGDRIVDVVREELSATFGDAGRGVLLTDRLAPYGPRVRAGTTAGDWEPRTLGEMKLAPLPFGISGVYHQSLTPRAHSRFTLEGEPEATVWWTDVPGGGPLSVHVDGDGHPLATTQPQGSGETRSLHVTLPAGARSLELVAESRGTVVQGVVLQRAQPGIVLDTLGVPSADANLFLRAREELFRAQLAERDPRLLLFILGGNEAKRLEWRRSDLSGVEQGLRGLVRRARAAAPEAACLVVGPIDAVRGGTGSQRLVQRPFLGEVLALERRIALAEGCAYFDLFSAMGGAGSLARMLQAGLVHEDLVHPRGQGLDLLGQLLTDALLGAWADASSPAPSPLPSTTEALP